MKELPPKKMTGKGSRRKKMSSPRIHLPQSYVGIRIPDACQRGAQSMERKDLRRGLHEAIRELREIQAIASALQDRVASSEAKLAELIDLSNARWDRDE